MYSASLVQRHDRGQSRASAEWELNVERNHRSVKVIAARKQRPVSEAVNLYNATPRDGVSASSSPASVVNAYPLRDRVRGPVENCEVDRDSPSHVSAPYRVGDAVWVRKPKSRCTEQSRRSVVTATVSPQVVEVDGVPWHVRDLWSCGNVLSVCSDVSAATSPGPPSEDVAEYVLLPADVGESATS